MITLTRSLERIFNPRRYTSIVIYLSSSDISEYTLLQIAITFFIYKKYFLGGKENCTFFCSFFFEILKKFSDFVNSDDCIGKITSKSIRINSDFVLKHI